jgi:hypothetical protein
MRSARRMRAATSRKELTADSGFLFPRQPAGMNHIAPSQH